MTLPVHSDAPWDPVEFERQLRANYSAVRIISILKNGVHFTTPALERIAERYLTIQVQLCCGIVTLFVCI